MKSFKKSALSGATCLRSAALAAAMIGLAASQTAYAQDAAESEEEAADEGSPIVVTGSRIMQPNLNSANPVAVVTGEELFETGSLSVGDQLNDLPQLRSTYSQQNSTRFLGTRGLNLLDLRGMGTQRTLVLVNGRRHVAGDLLSNGVSPDVNTIPTDLIERIDIVTGGASGVYGSDAIAGVVNFILKDNYDGIQLRGQAGISKYNDAGNQYVSLLAGKNFADGRGNAALNVEFAHSSPFYASNRPAFVSQDNFIVVDSDPSGSDGVPDRIFYRDIRSATIATGGMLAFRHANSTAPCGADQTGVAFTCAYRFQPDGSLIPQTGTRVGLAPNGNFIGGNGYSGREGKLLTFQPDLERISVNFTSHFEISPALVPFVEAKWVRTKAFGSQSGPFFSQGQTLADSVLVAGFNDRSFASTTGSATGRVNREGVRLDNPYLSAAARATITQQALDAVNANVNPNTGSAFTSSAQSIANKNRVLAQIADGSFRFALRRNWVDLGIRDEEIKRETFRIVGGLKGDFNDDWHYELSVNYGQHKEENSILGNVNVQRFLLANDAGIDPNNVAAGIQCRAKFDPAYSNSYVTGDIASDPRLAGDIAACVPLNPFGDGSVSDAARKYLLVDSRATGKITQLDILGYVSGDTSSFLNLPGGPISFSVGGEYRRETNYYDLDDLTQEGYAFYNAIPSFTAPSFEVKEAYGEIALPILSDMPFFEELTLRGSGRISDYKGKTGTVYTYGGEVIWKPVEDITFRGTYARAIRAPNLSELYSEPGQNFAPGFSDPCSFRNLGSGSSFRAANCAAAGRPTDVTVAEPNGYDYVYSASLEIISGGNVNLKEETSDSWTVGALLQPRWVPGLSISVDYFDIEVTNVITAPSAQQIVNACYDLENPDNFYCTLFERAGEDGGPNGEREFRVVEGSLIQISQNYAARRARGIDAQINYSTKFDWGKVQMGAIWTHMFQRDNFTNPADPTFADRILNELGDPNDQVNFNAALTVGKLTFGYQMRWIDSMYVNAYEDFNPLNGQPPQNADYAAFSRYPSVFYHDVRLGLEVNDKFDIYLGVDNLSDRKPPYGLTGVGAGSGIYDVKGRYMYAGVVAKF